MQTPNSEAIEIETSKIRAKIKSKEWDSRYILSIPDDTLNINRSIALKRAKAWCEADLARKSLGLDSWADLINNDKNYKLLHKVSFPEESAKYPMQLCNLIGDEVKVAFLDFETTGLSHTTDRVIELGLVILKFSPSAGKITSIDKVISEYNDPNIPIPPMITEITGISDDDVKGKAINVNQLFEWLEDEKTYVIAHNAKFDRPFFEKLTGLDNYRWGCSANQVDWTRFKTFRIESTKLEYILLKLGYFYEGHRASIDCLAMVQMFITVPEALVELIENIDKKSFVIEATRAPFATKDELKHLNYRWNADKKVWIKIVFEDELNESKLDLDRISGYQSTAATITELTARNRFKLN
jgi:DNA polymerase-3 subunit epsilon